MILTRNRIRVFVMGGLALVLAASISLVLSAPTWAQEAPEQGPSEGCPNPEEVATFSGTGDNPRTDLFQVTGDTIRIRYFKDPSADTIFLDLLDEGSNFSGSNSAISDQPTGFFNIGVIGDPGQYFLDIDVEDGTNYVLAVDNCNGGGNGGDGSGNGGGSASDQYSLNLEVTNIINIPAKDLPDTGGPPLLAILFSAAAGLGLITAAVRRRH